MSINLSWIFGLSLIEFVWLFHPFCTKFQLKAGSYSNLFSRLSTLIPIQIETSIFPLILLFGYCNFNLKPQYVRLLKLFQLVMQNFMANPPKCLLKLMLFSVTNSVCLIGCILNHLILAIQHQSHCQWQAHCRRYPSQWSSIPCQTSQSGAGELHLEDGSLGTRPWKSCAKLWKGSSMCAQDKDFM